MGRQNGSPQGVLQRPRCCAWQQSRCQLLVSWSSATVVPPWSAAFAPPARSRTPKKKIQKVPKESERWGGDVGWEHGVGVKCWVHTWDKGLKLLVKLQFQQELDALDGGVAASQAGSLRHMPAPVKIDLLVGIVRTVGMRTIRPSLSGHRSNSGGGLVAWRTWSAESWPFSIPKRSQLGVK